MSNKFKLYWISHQVLGYLASISTTIFVDFYIWENTKSISSILKFNLGLFLIYPLAVLVGSLLVETLGLKLSQIVAKTSQAIFVFLLLFLGVRLISDPLVFGILAGLVLGTAFAPADVIAAKIDPTIRLDINSKIKAGTITAGIIFPPVFSLLVDQQGTFTVPFTIALFVYLLLLVTSLFVSFPEVDGKFNLKEIFSFPGNNPEKGILLKSAFLTGLHNSIHYSLIGVLLLSFIGSLTSWGWFKLGLSIFSLILVLIYKKLKVSNQSILSLGLGALVFLLGSAYFAYNFALLGVFVYAIAIAIYEVFYGFGITGAMTRLTELDVSGEDLSSEYTFFTSLFTSIGLILPIAFLNYFQVDLQDPTMFIAVLIFIAFIPFTILKVMSKSFHLTHPS
jgi:MFS transporter, YQGE family, putative transporter